MERTWTFPGGQGHSFHRKPALFKRATGWHQFPAASLAAQVHQSGLQGRRQRAPAGAHCRACVGRGNGKTALASVLALCHLAGPESESRGEVYAAANDRFQSSRVFNELAAIIQRTPWLKERCSVRRYPKEIEDFETGSLFVSLSADAPTKAGLSPTFVVVDELGQAKSRELYDVLRTSLSKRAEPLLMTISTQAANDEAPLSQLIDYGLRVNNGETVDRSFHLTLFSAPMEADPFVRETWKKANPALGDFLSFEAVRVLAIQAQRMPASEMSFRNTVLNQRVDTSPPFLTWRYGRRTETTNTTCAS